MQLSPSVFGNQNLPNVLVDSDRVDRFEQQDLVLSGSCTCSVIWRQLLLLMHAFGQPQCRVWTMS
jgi:hypothetical protein